MQDVAPGSSVVPTSPRHLSRQTLDSGQSVVIDAGYRPELRRSLRLFSLFAISFSIISITTGIFLNYGFGLTHLGPASIWT